MIIIEEALKILDGTSVTPQVEEVKIEESLNRVLAQDIASKINMPPFDKSAMDGYAYLSGDTSDRFKILETISAGAVPQTIIKKGQCAKIMTGGMVPPGADRVIKRELTVEEDNFMKITEEEDNRNICYQGEDVRTGDIVLKSGTLLRSQEIGIIASMGLASIKAFRRPQVGIVATGSELVAPGNPLLPGRIYNSNTFSLAAQVLEAGAILKSSATAVDTIDEIQDSIDRFLTTCDMVLISGGVSAGDFDYVPNVLRDLEVKLHFEKIAIQPGKPTVFGTRGDKIVFGIPGNPVSTFVIFEILIKPLLFKMMGHVYRPKTIQAKMRERFKRIHTERTAYTPIYYQDGYVDLLTYHGSAHIHALAKANGLICIPRGEHEILAGTKVNVRQI